MKRIAISLIGILMLSYFSFAQEETLNLLNFNTVVKNIQRSDLEIKDEKKNIKTSTWTNRGKYYLDAFEVNIQMLQLGWGYDDIVLYKGKAKEEKSIDGYQVYVYDNIDLYFKEGALQKWVETNPAHEDPLPIAYEAFMKGIELDEKGKTGKRIKNELARLSGFAVSKAIDFYTVEDYENSFKFFDIASKATEVDGYDAPIDTTLYFNAGLTANLAKKNKLATEYYIKAIKFGYPDANVFHFLTDVYINELNDTLAAIEGLKMGFEKHPKDQRIVLLLIDSYIKTGQAESAMSYIDIAKKNDPANSALYFAEGALQEELGDDGKAEAAYKKAIELDPKSFNSLFNLGIMYYNQAVNIFDVLGDIQDKAKFDAEEKKAFDNLKNSVPQLEQAFEVGQEIKVGDASLKIVAETLRTIYYRLIKEDESYQKKYDDMEMTLKTFE